MIAMNSVLALNTHMPYVLTPIISACYSSIKPHEIMFNNSSKSPKISFFLKWREDSNLVKAQEAKQIAAGISSPTISTSYLLSPPFPSCSFSLLFSSASPVFLHTSTPLLTETNTLLC